MHTRILSGLLLSATLSLLLASCGGGGPAPAADDDAATITPVTGGSIAWPANSTAAGEFIVTGVRAQALAQSLGFNTPGSDTGARGHAGSTVKSVMAGQRLGAQALGDEMRILLTVNRAKTGVNAGRKRAQVIFVWGNQTETATSYVSTLATGAPYTADAYWIRVHPDNQPFMYLPGDTNLGFGKLGLKVDYPNFQDKTSRSSPYIADSGKTCARLEFDFTTVRNDGTTAGYVPMTFSNASAPLAVCEGVTERAAEQLALEKATAAMQFTDGSVVPANFTYTRWDGRATMPTNADLTTAAAAPLGSVVDTLTLDAFFTPFTALPPGTSATWTDAQKAQAALANRWIGLKKQYGFYFNTATVKIVRTSASRDDIFILGLNGWGVGGLKTLRLRQ